MKSSIDHLLFLAANPSDSLAADNSQTDRIHTAQEFRRRISNACRGSSLVSSNGHFSEDARHFLLDFAIGGGGGDRRSDGLRHDWLSRWFQADRGGAARIVLLDFRLKKAFEIAGQLIAEYGTIFVRSQRLGFRGARGGGDRCFSPECWQNAFSGSLEKICSIVLVNHRLVGSDCFR